MPVWGRNGGPKGVRTVQHLALLCLLLLPVVPPNPQEAVEITRTDDSRVTGLWLGFEDGKYRIQSDGQLVEIPEARVKHVVILQVSLPPAVPTIPAAAKSELTLIEEAIRIQDFERALHLVTKLQERLTGSAPAPDAPQDDVRARYLRALADLSDIGNLAKRLEELRTLPEADQRHFLELLLERMAGEPERNVVAEFALSTAAALTAGLPVPPDLKERLLQRLHETAKVEAERGRGETVEKLYSALMRLDPTRRDSILEQLTGFLLERARSLRDSGDPAGALSSLRTLLGHAPGHAEALSMLEPLEFAHLQQEIAALPPLEAVRKLQSFLKTARPADQARWAEELLATLLPKTTVAGVEISDDLQRYFPLEIGRRLNYRRGEKGFYEQHTIDSVLPNGPMSNVYLTLQEYSIDEQTGQRKWLHRKRYRYDLDRSTIARVGLGGRKSVLLRSPLSVGDSWTSEDEHQNFVTTVRSTTATVTVPAGTFENCAVLDVESVQSYEETSERVITTSTYAPGVGLIKMDIDKPALQRFTLELLDIQPPSGR